jgi:hypothetical protein
VNTSTTAKVQYTYVSGSSNTIRATGLVYPSGRVLTYSYGSTGGQSDRLSRDASYIDDDGTSRIIGYTFLGAGTFVESDGPQPIRAGSCLPSQPGVRCFDLGICSLIALASQRQAALAHVSSIATTS